MDATTHNRKPIDKALRRKLEATVIEAREVAEQAAAQALNRLSVGESAPEDYLDEQQRKLRNRLRAHGRQLGDIRRENGVQGIKKLATEVAYEHWHRMLFARFLEQNQLLMYDADINVTLADCDELIRDGVFQDDMEAHCSNGWELAAVLASKMLPQIFRIDSSVFELQFAPEHQRKLEQLVTGLASETFQAQDSLGWVYQFWQTKRKEEVNKSEVKIGADELSPVTQLFTEHYMVSFLLDNALGAWWAGQRLTDEDWKNAESEQELRDKAAIPGVPLAYLRFVKDDDGSWTPASGTFEAWPQKLSELKTLDPCCGSGHFLVAALLMLVPMRMEMEALNAKTAVDKVLAENLHGLELDQRCVELAAFALAMEAWRYPDADGYRSLPEMHLACSGLSILAARGEWKELSRKAGKQNLTIGLDLMYDTFRDAPVLGSLINPRRSNAAKVAKWDELQELLSEALEQEESRNPGGPEETERFEAGIAAKGITKAAELLARKYQWVITNVPYLARGKQSESLRDFCEEHYPAAKSDLATVFLDRCLDFCVKGGTSSVVLPQNWLFLTTYKKFREKLLRSDRWHLIARLGAGAFETISGEVVKAILINVSAGVRTGHSADLLGPGEEGAWISSLDVAGLRTASGKATGLAGDDLKIVQQAQQLRNPDSRVILGKTAEGEYLRESATSYLGICSGDYSRFGRVFWEVEAVQADWEFQRSSFTKSELYDGMTQVFYWQRGQGEFLDFLCERLGEKQVGSWLRGGDAWGQEGIVVTATGSLPVCKYTGELFDNNVSVIIPDSIDDLPSLWAYSSSSQFHDDIRAFNQQLKITDQSFIEVVFDKSYWNRVAEERYPKGLPLPYSNDPNQWIFHGHPCGSVIWDEETKRTGQGDLRLENTVLQVAVARLLGYRWPSELDLEMELANEQRACVEQCQALAGHVDDDGIVCLPAVRGEKSADQRLEALLQEAYGQEWTIPLKNRLLETVGSKSLSLWLRDKFFEQHCKLFQHRPFIWHIWDGLKDGFSVLINYHKLDKAGLERLIYTYLGDWVRTQQTAVADDEDGADVRLAAAQTLKKELEAILEGEAPYDIFVRWKPVEKQPIGWNPDLNDGVRLNIRPFIEAQDLGKKGAGILRAKPNIHWKKDRGKDVPSAPWYSLGLEHGEKEGARINDHHLSLDEKKKARS
jgi:hypothetical protein